MVVFCVCSLYRDQRSDVRSFEPRAPLQEPEGPVHELHLCGRQPGAHVAQGREPGPELLAVHPRGDWLRAHLARGRSPHRVAPPSDHQGTDAVQTQHPRQGFRSSRDTLQDVKP